MKKRLGSILILFVLLMTSCKPENQQDMLKSAVENVNEKNEKLNAPTDIPQKYYYIPDEQKRFQQEDFKLLPEVGQKLTITKDEVQKELSWLLRLLRTYYGGYGKFGGDAVFEKAVNDILNEIGEKEEIGNMEYQELLGKHFSFVKDNHFLIGPKTSGSYAGHLYGKESERFYQKSHCFYDDSTSKNAIIAIDGEKPEKFLKLSIDKEGKLCYLPYIFEEENADHTLILEYEDGKERKISLAMTDYVSSRQYDDSKSGNYQEIEEKSGKKIIYNHFKAIEDDSSAKFIESAEHIKESPYIVYDISLNSGGQAETLEKWFETYTGEVMQPNHSQLIRKDFFHIQINEDIEEETEKLDDKMKKFDADDDGNYYTWIPEKQFVDVDSDALVFLITSSVTVSCGELMTDACRNIKNTIVIGGNTFGGLSGDASTEFFTLPFSGVGFNFGMTVFNWEKEYFQENIGFAPDIYLTGTDCEERLDKFLEYYVK